MHRNTFRRKTARTGISAATAVAGATALLAVGAVGAGTASAAPTAPAMHRPPHNGTCLRVRERTSGAFSNNMNILSGWIVPGSVSVVATQGTTPGQDNPPVDTFGPGTGYTVSPNWHVVTLAPPYAGSNDGFVTHYGVFKRACFLPRHFHLQTRTSGAFSNNQNVLNARNIVPGSVYVVATQGQSPGFNNPSVNGFARGNGYTVSYTRHGATVTLQSPYAGSNDGFTSYYTVAQHH
jgi:hypothetical protein